MPIADVAASFREAVVDVLVTKALDACAQFGVPRLLLGGGVIANRRLREVASERAAATTLAGSGLVRAEPSGKITVGTVSEPSLRSRT